MRRKKEKDELTSLVSDLVELQSRLRLLRSPANELAQALSQKGCAKEFWSGMSKELDLGKTPLNAYKAAESILLNKTSKTVLEELFNQFGSSDAETEQKRILLAIESLKAAKQKYDSEFERSVKLRRSLSVLMGIAAALILL